MDSLRNFVCSSLHMFKSSFWAENRWFGKKKKGYSCAEDEWSRYKSWQLLQQPGRTTHVTGGRLWGLYSTKSHHSVKGQTAGKQDFVRLTQNTLLVKTHRLEVAQLGLILLLCSFYHNMYIAHIELVGCSFGLLQYSLPERYTEGWKQKKAVVTNPGLHHQGTGKGKGKTANTEEG